MAELMETLSSFFGSSMSSSFLPSSSVTDTMLHAVVSSTQIENTRQYNYDSALASASSAAEVSCDMASKEWPIAIAAIFAYFLFALALSILVYLYRFQVRRFS